MNKGSYNKLKKNCIHSLIVARTKRTANQLTYASRCWERPKVIPHMMHGQRRISYTDGTHGELMKCPSRPSGDQDEETDDSGQSHKPTQAQCLQTKPNRTRESRLSSIRSGGDPALDIRLRLAPTPSKRAQEPEPPAFMLGSRRRRGGGCGCGGGGSDGRRHAVLEVVRVAVVVLLRRRCSDAEERSVCCLGNGK